MANLADSQKISRVLGSLPFGNGIDGALTISSNTTQSLTDESCSGSSGGTTLTAGGTSLATGDVVLIIQMRGTGVGLWEVNKIASGGGTVNLVTQINLANTYTDSGASQAQVIKIPMYTSVTIDNTFTWSAKAWDGNVGGILVYAAKVGTTVTGTISGDTLGFDGGDGNIAGEQTGDQGEGSSGVGTNAQAANGSGGGGGTAAPASAKAGGGGGGNGVAGTAGGTVGAFPGGAAGGTTGTADLVTFVIGGGGGQGGYFDTGGTAGNSGSGIMAFSKDLTITGGITTDGGAGGTAGSGKGGSGGGSGGSAIFSVATATLGTNLITVAAGAGGTKVGSDEAGGAGGVGRIAVHHSGAITGSSTPAFDNTTDTSLIDGSGNFLAFL